MASPQCPDSHGSPVPSEYQSISTDLGISHLPISCGGNPLDLTPWTRDSVGDCNPVRNSELQSSQISNPESSHPALRAVVIVSSPCPCGPVSRIRRRIANAIPTNPSTENIHIPS